MSLSPGIDLEVSARLCASLDANTMAVRDQERARRELFADVSYIPNYHPFSFAGTTMPVVWPGFKPRQGWNWAVQRITVVGLGTSDFVNVARGHTAMTNSHLLLFTFTIPLAGTVATWTPGRTGLLMRGHDMPSLVFSGSSTSTALYVNADIIQVTDAQLPYFLL